MLKNKITKTKGFTLTELMIAMVISIVVILGLGFVLADSHQGWQSAYEKAHSDIVTGGQAARRRFDAIIRKASSQSIKLGTGGSEVKVYYYNSSASSELDRYARFYVQSNQLKIDYGNLVSSSEVRQSTQTVCSDVSSCTFTNTGDSVQMVLVLDDGSNTITTVSSAVAHN